MYSFEMIEWINRSVSEVFEFLSNPPNAAQYIDNIKDGHKITEGPTRVGTRFSETRLVHGKESMAELAVTEYNPPLTFGISNETMGVEIMYIYHLAPEHNGTGIRWVCKLKASGLKRMMLPLIAGMLKKEDGAHLKKVKSLLENKENTG